MRLPELVKPVLHMIGRQQSGEVKFHAKEVKQRVGILRAGEPLERIGRAIGENLLLEQLQGLRPRLSHGLGRFFRRHVARLEDRNNGLEQLRIREQLACWPVQPHLALLFLRAVAFHAVQGEELFQLRFRREEPLRGKNQECRYPIPPHHANKSKAPELSPKRSLRAPNCCSRPR